MEYQRLARDPRTYVPGTVSVEGRTFQQVGVRLKGTGTFQPIGRRPNLALKFNWRIPHQEFCGLTKIYLNNSRQDPSFLCELIAGGAFADGGVPVPRITHARLVLNGRDLGPCVVAEAVNRHFLGRHFKSADGRLYEGEFRDINSPLELDSGPPGDDSNLQALVAAASMPDPVERCRALAQVLDVEEFLNFLAVEMIVANWDGYAFHQNNYRIYHDPVSGKMAFIPHGLDNAVFESGLSLIPPRRSLLSAALLSTPADREAFKRRVADLLPRVLDPARTQARLQAGVHRLCQCADPATAEAFRRRGEILQNRLQERRRHLHDELEGKRPLTPAFGWLGTAPLTGWQPKPDWNDSPVSIVRTGGKACLSVEATNGWCFGSWRLPVWLPPGRYRIEGMTKTAGVAGLPSRTGSGAGVRVLGSMRGSGVQGSSPSWVPVQHRFVVEPGCEWVELIAELRGFRGSALFDPDSLRLIRERF